MIAKYPLLKTGRKIDKQMIATKNIDTVLLGIDPFINKTLRLVKKNNVPKTPELPSTVARLLSKTAEDCL